MRLSQTGKPQRSEWRAYERKLKMKNYFTTTEHRELQIVEPSCILKAACTEIRGTPAKYRFLNNRGIIYKTIENDKCQYALRNITNFVSKDKAGFRCTWNVILASIKWFRKSSTLTDATNVVINLDNIPNIYFLGQKEILRRIYLRRVVTISYLSVIIIYNI